LVLGGGGVIGLAYHSAALAAMELDLGWDPRAADVIVGTSAGSLVGALLRRGVPPSDLAATTVGALPRSSPATAAEALAERPDFPAVTIGSFLGRPRVPGVGVVTAWARRPWRFDPVAALASVVPDGAIDMGAHTAAVDRLLGRDWPVDDLWVPVVRRHDLQRIIVGREVTAPLADAVRASCSVPGYFRPVILDGTAHVDGGVRSPTNADVLSRRELDLVIVISPMSGRDLGRLGLGNLIRRRARRQAEAERAQLIAAGIPSILIEPGPEVVEALGSDPMSSTNLRGIVQAAFVDAGEQLRAPITRTLLAGLKRRRTQRAAGPARALAAQAVGRP
jgi:NTE family protein